MANIDAQAASEVKDNEIDIIIREYTQSQKKVDYNSIHTPGNVTDFAIGLEELKKLLNATKDSNKGETYYDPCFTIDDKIYELNMNLTVDEIYILVDELMTRKKYHVRITADRVKELTQKSGFELTINQFFNLLKSGFGGKSTIAIYNFVTSCNQYKGTIRFEIIWTFTILNSLIKKVFEITLGEIHQKDFQRAEKLIQDLQKDSIESKNNVKILSNLSEKLDSLEKDFMDAITYQQCINEIEKLRKEMYEHIEIINDRITIVNDKGYANMLTETRILFNEMEKKMVSLNKQTKEYAKQIIHEVMESDVDKLHDTVTKLEDRLKETNLEISDNAISQEVIYKKQMEDENKNLSAKILYLENEMRALKDILIFKTQPRL